MKRSVTFGAVAWVMCFGVFFSSREIAIRRDVPSGGQHDDDRYVSETDPLVLPVKRRSRAPTMGTWMLVESWNVECGGI